VSMLRRHMQLHTCMKTRMHLAASLLLQQAQVTDLRCQSDAAPSLYATLTLDLIAGVVREDAVHSAQWRSIRRWQLPSWPSYQSRLPRVARPDWKATSPTLL